MYQPGGCNITTQGCNYQHRLAQGYKISPQRCNISAQVCKICSQGWDKSAQGCKMVRCIGISEAMVRLQCISRITWGRDPSADVASRGEAEGNDNFNVFIYASLSIMTWMPKEIPKTRAPLQKNGGREPRADISVPSCGQM